ncbi:MAG: hypothetical protein F4Z57_03215 [Gemmatimonadetes bacterium]|nr:hypothetical protein [Gemmatimonadota bacterium]MYC72887.1 hypothetical protein [Gemmatimonadota bacterium]
MKKQIAEVAAKSVEVLLADNAGTSALRDGQLLWSLSHLWDQPRYRRQAEQVAEGSERAEAAVRGSLALAEGLAACGYWERARTLVLQSLARCDAADYVGESPEGQPMPKGARCLDDWAQVLSVCTRLLHVRADRELQIAAARAVAAILNYHYHPDLGGLLFAVRGDFFHFDEYWGTCVYSEAALAVLTAMLDEAGRRGETHLCALAGRYLRQHVEAAWDPIEGGIRREYSADVWSAEKPGAVQAAAVGALATLHRYQGGDWEAEWLERVRDYQRDCPTDPLTELRRLVRCTREPDKKLDIVN